MADDKGAVVDFIFKNVEEHTTDIAALLVQEFGFSRQRANFYLSREVERGTLIPFGNTRARRYFLAGGSHIEFQLPLEGLSEDRVWLRYIKPMVLAYPNNILRIANYGFTEILNNAIDHSGGTSAYVSLQRTQGKLQFTIMDNGIGIYEKIKQALNLSSPREAILHLSKGKFTTDPSNHTGQGIFFTSRIFDKFSISSDDMYYSFSGMEWFLSNEKPEKFGNGTSIQMEVSLDSKITPEEIMDKYSDLEIGFTKTIVAVALSEDPNDPHVSRSQAKRLMMGLEKFQTIVLDFKGVGSVGQAFVDEVFRVFQNEYPNIRIQYINANPEVDLMIKRGLATG